MQDVFLYTLGALIKENSIMSNETAEKEQQEKAPTLSATSHDSDSLKPGSTVRVHQIITEKNSKGEEKKRIQVFEGIVLAKKHGKQDGATITVRKVASGVGVEKIFPLNSPWIEKIEVTKQAQVRRAKLHYLRNFTKKLKEKKVA